MVEFLIKFLLVVRSKLKSRARLEAENIILRQQVIVLSGRAPLAGAAPEHLIRDRDGALGPAYSAGRLSASCVRLSPDHDHRT
jgi:hypothetical protein